MRIRTAEQALQDAAVEWQSTFDAIRDGVALLDRPGIVQRANAALPAFLGAIGRDRRPEPGRMIPPAAGDPSWSVLDSLRRTTVERGFGGADFRE